MTPTKLNKSKHNSILNSEVFFSGLDLDINDTPSWITKVNFSSTQTDLIVGNLHCS